MHESGRQRLFRKLLPAAGLVLLLAGACLLFLPNPSLRLADGRRLSVLDVSYGTNHVFIGGPPWMQAFWRFLPVSTRYRHGFSWGERSSAQPSCMIWAYWRLPGSNAAARFVSVVDRHGLESEPISATVVTPIPKSPDAIVGWLLENYPRTESRVHLRFYERDSAYRPIPVGELAVRNPARGVARWHARPAPVTATNNGIEFTLTQLQCGVPAPIPNSPSSRFDSNAVWTAAQFEVREPRPSSAAWTVRQLELRSATGNRVAVSPARCQSKDPIEVLFPAILWPAEPDWRVTAEFSRTANFDPQDVVTARGLVLRPSPAVSTNHLTLALNGLQLKSLAVVRHVTHIRPYVRGAYRPNTEVTLVYLTNSATSGSTSGRAQESLHVSLARIVDDRGRELRFGDEDDSARGYFTAALEVPGDAQALDVSFAVHRSRWAEFTVRPAWVATNRSSAFAPLQ